MIVCATRQAGSLSHYRGGKFQIIASFTDHPNHHQPRSGLMIVALSRGAGSGGEAGWLGRRRIVQRSHG